MNNEMNRLTEAIEKEAISSLTAKLGIELSTEHYFDTLFPTPQLLLDSRTPVFKNVIIYGAQGFGKTECARSIAYKATQYYGTKYCNIAISSDLKKLLLEGLRPRPINILIAEDLTLRKVEPETLSNYYRIRHLAMRRGIKKGLILSIITLHDFYAVPKALRSYFDSLILVQPPTNKFDYNLFRSYVNSDTMEKLMLLQQYKTKDNKYKAIKAYWILGETGFMETELAPNNLQILDLDGEKEPVWRTFLRTSREEEEEEEEGMEWEMDTEEG